MCGLIDLSRRFDRIKAPWTLEEYHSFVFNVWMIANSMDSLLYSFLEELLYLFNTSEFIARAVRVDRFDVPDSSSPGSGPAHVEATLYVRTIVYGTYFFFNHPYDR